MTTPTDEPTETFPPAVVRRLALLGERVASGATPDERELAELAGLMAGPMVESPEAALVLAGLYERLGPLIGGPPPLSWRTAALPVKVRIAWLRAELLNEPTVVRQELPGELLYQAVRQASVTSAHRPNPLVAELAGSGDPVLQAEALRLARQGLHAGLLAPALVREHLVGLLGADSAEVVAAALGELTQPWAAQHPLPSELLASFLAASPAATRPGAADAALAAAAHHGHRDVMRQAVENPDLPPRLRRRALELLGDLAERGDIGELTTLAAQDPLLLGGPAVTCLRGLHRRGHFPDDRAVRSIVGLALADHTIAPDEIATVLFTCRQVMFRLLVDVAADDPSWPRRLALLVALAGQGPGELPIGEEITRVLRLSPSPGPFLDAIRRLRHAEAEDAVIDLLPSAPLAALNALEAMGGHRTVTALAEGLGLPPDGGPDTAPGEGEGVIVPHLRAVRNQALEVLWHLSHEPHQRHRILVRLDPADLPARIATDLGAPDERELALLSSHLDPDKPVEALCRLAAHGGARTLPLVSDLLLAVVREQAAVSEPGGADTRPPASGEPAGEPAVPQEVIDALYALGCRLHERGKIRPACLLDAADAPEAGHALVATVALDLLDRPGLSGGEQSILLGMLLDAPSPRTRPRVHRLLRSRDRHVRKRVIALLAQDATGHDAQALSATLITLTAAHDIQTVRQALLALGQARAGWASAAIAACLSHPNMNVKKTAAEVLARAGTAAAAPALLFWLGHHDNPGLRATLVKALRGILGAAYAATLLAAAERGEDSRTRELLLAGLDGVLPARSVLALDGQASPVAPTLLALVAAGRVALASGTIADLAVPLARHGITVPAARKPQPEPDPDENGKDPEVASLLTEGWNSSVALRIADRHEPPHPDRLRELRPMLADWLRLAGSAPNSAGTARSRVLGLTLRLCPAPRSAGELATFARFVHVLLDGLTDARGGHGHDLVTLLEEVAPILPAVEKLSVTDAVRALPAEAAGGRSVLPLLRRCGAVLVRTDLDRALAAVRLGANPWQAETVVLRDAFAVPRPPVPAGTEAEAWGTRLREAVRTPSGLEEFRRNAPADDAPGSRDRLRALIDAYTAAGPDVRDALLDWMTVLQPLDAPAWTITETTDAPAPRLVHIDDLDQPRSAAQRERLLAMLNAAAPDRRDAAALTLAKWPEPEIARHVLRAFLRGSVTVPVNAGLARTLNSFSETELTSDEILPGRVVFAARRLDDPEGLRPLLPLLLRWWEHGPPAIRPEAGQALNGVPADMLAAALADRIDAGAWGLLDLLAGRPLLRTPQLDRVNRRLRAAGRDDLADRLRFVDGPLRGPDAEQRDAAVLAELRERARTAPGPADRPSREDLLNLARTGDAEQIRRALNRLAEEHHGPAPDQDPALRLLIGELLKHPRPKVRLHAHRTSRAMLGRPAHMHHTAVLLDDPQPDVARLAVRTLCHAAWEPAIPTVIDMLTHSHPVVRKAAREGLTRMGASVVPALRHAADHARPDKRSLYTDLLTRITSADDRP
ncbi:HEAT repeat domain-containing protein [Streptomyces sp. ISL-100]|uniref:HEAT repeat domain-containing protein n=1 Tax=Streptomyces sp. ISL-100 TaxID=2819173 RepID=UPI001BE52AFE|nr:HEAT repeat domain-containing protein [Streptomyces sp. ISL-100]MBT2396767.1 HEAT repeat domain-containing protein [Streptomyces sp. ISL-100]